MLVKYRRDYSPGIGAWQEGEAMAFLGGIILNGSYGKLYEIWIILKA
jgi:hypothetical protein